MARRAARIRRASACRSEGGLMELKTDFEAFLREIRPTQSQRSDLQTGHRALRDRLRDDEELKNVVVSDFLQGSYRRGAAAPPQGGKGARRELHLFHNPF